MAVQGLARRSPVTTFLSVSQMASDVNFTTFGASKIITSENHNVCNAGDF
jgi:hypothetical protein